MAKAKSKAPAKAAKPESPKKDPKPAGRRKILIIEDDPAIVDSLVVLLKGKFDLDAANDGEEGLIKVKSFKPDLIILDLLMPGRDGFDVARRIKGDPKLKGIPIIALSSFTELYDMNFGQGGAEKTLPTEVYLTKPLDPATLLREIKEHLG
jgi:CheY-like chemotaxis protein